MATNLGLARTLFNPQQRISRSTLLLCHQLTTESPLPIHFNNFKRRRYATEAKVSKPENGKGKKPEVSDEKKAKDSEDSESTLLIKGILLLNVLDIAPYTKLDGLFGGLKRRANSSAQSSNTKSNNSPSSNKSDAEESKETPIFSFQIGLGGNQNSNKNNNNQNRPPNFNLTSLIFPALLTYFAYRSLSPNDGFFSREITWQEFRTAFLDKGLVDRLEVINRSKVRVHLHSNATGTVYPTSSPNGSASSNTSYYFSIGSVEAFERKLDEAQIELSIPSSERVPVAYKEEISLLGTALSMAPTLLLIGFLVYAGRRASGSVGRGGGGGIFGVGKSKARMFNVRCLVVNCQRLTKDV